MLDVEFEEEALSETISRESSNLANLSKRGSKR